jgi:hypothetical protein
MVSPLTSFEMEPEGPIGPQSCRSLRTQALEKANTPIYCAGI